MSILLVLISLTIAAALGAAFALAIFNIKDNLKD